MKSSKQGKLSLNKKAIAQLDPANMRSIAAGEEAAPEFTSIFHCSKGGFTCQCQTLANNICVQEEEPDAERLETAARLANLHDFIQSLPLGYQTRIGASGMGMSAGQKQRLLIARALYKDPDFLFFDEATSALDARNEKEITENLAGIFRHKTVVIIAHRLSTVRRADHIVLLHEGRVAEQGRHEELLRNRSHYFHLVSNQLELTA